MYSVRMEIGDKRKRKIEGVGKLRRLNITIKVSIYFRLDWVIGTVEENQALVGVVLMLMPGKVTRQVILTIRSVAEMMTLVAQESMMWSLSEGMKNMSWDLAKLGSIIHDYNVPGSVREKRSKDRVGIMFRLGADAFANCCCEYYGSAAIKSENESGKHSRPEASNPGNAGNKNLRVLLHQVLLVCQT